MTYSLKSTITLHNGVEMPRFGLGVFKVEDHIASDTVKLAIDAGYIAIDTAAAYRNEKGVGLGIAKSGLPREQIFVTTKIWNADQGYEQAWAAFEKSRELLNMEVIDLLLVHWPVKGKYIDTYRALEEIYEKGYVRAIGVSTSKFII